VNTGTKLPAAPVIVVPVGVMATMTTSRNHRGTATLLAVTDHPRINPDGRDAWIAEHLNIDRDIVTTVLDVEFEYMIGVGIARPFSPDDTDYEFKYYDPIELLRAPRVVDSLRISHDVERFTGIDAELANDVLNGEHEFLKMRGLA
jgi:hypothetical protein